MKSNSLVVFVDCNTQTELNLVTITISMGCLCSSYIDGALQPACSVKQFYTQFEQARA
jgi:hypothetical protein